jgi:hypothetical protein
MILAIGLLALSVASPMPAHATEEDAKTLFAQGRKLRAEGNCTEAIVAFRRALDVYPQGLGALRNIAECEEQLGRFASARNDWWSLRRAVLMSNEPKYEGWDKDAEQAHARLEGKVGRLTVNLRGEGLQRVQVTIDGKPLDPRLIGVELERDLGRHIIEALYGGATPVRKQLDLAAGQREVVTLDIPAPAKATGPVAARGRTPLPPDTGDGAMRAAGIVALAVGGVGLVGTVISVIERGAALSAIDEECPSHTGCSPELQAEEQRGRTAATLANIFGAVTIIGMGAGVPLLFLGGGSREAPKNATATAVRVRMGVAPLGGGAAAQIGGSF